MDDTVRPDDKFIVKGYCQGCLREAQATKTASRRLHNSNVRMRKGQPSGDRDEILAAVAAARAVRLRRDVRVEVTHTAVLPPALLEPLDADSMPADVSIPYYTCSHMPDFHETGLFGVCL